MEEIGHEGRGKVQIGQGEMFLGWCEREFKRGGLGRGE